MLSRPSSRFVDFGEVLKRARPSGNEAKRPSCSAKYRFRVYTHPIRLLQGSSAASRNLARFSTTYLSRQTPHHRDPRETLRPKLSLAMQPFYLLGIVDRSTGHVYRYCCFRPFLLRQFVPSENSLLQRVIGNGAIRPLQCRRLRRVHIDFVIHGKMDLSETERLRRVSRPRVVSSAP